MRGLRARVPVCSGCVVLLRFGGHAACVRACVRVCMCVCVSCKRGGAARDAAAGAVEEEG